MKKTHAKILTRLTEGPSRHRDLMVEGVGIFACAKATKALEDLYREGWVRTRPLGPPAWEGGPRPLEYSITEDGREALRIHEEKKW